MVVPVSEAVAPIDAVPIEKKFYQNFLWSLRYILQTNYNGSAPEILTSIYESRRTRMIIRELFLKLAYHKINKGLLS